MSAELIRRKLLGCRTSHIDNGYWYFLVSAIDRDVFVDVKTQHVIQVFLDGTVVDMGSATRVLAIIQPRAQYRKVWRIITTALEEYLKCPPS